MPSTLQQKLRIGPGTAIRTLNAPAHYASLLGRLPKGATITKGVTRGHAFIHLFVKDRAEVERHVPKAVKALATEGLLWISFPKGGRTDLTRDKGWETLEPLRLRWLSMISLDAEWSAFLLRNSPPTEPGRASKEYHERSSTWADAATKTIRVPDDLAVALKRNGEARRAFDALSYTNRKEYVLWVVGAKREETRTARVKATMEKLLNGLKNPADKGAR